MKNKKTLWTVVFIVLAAVIFAVVFYLAKDADRSAEETVDPYETKKFKSLEEAVEYAEFRLVHSDRLAGQQATGYVCSKRKIVVDFGGEGFISKELLVDPENETAETSSAASETVPTQTFEQVINGLTVLFYGEEDAVTAAHWTDNGYEYVISLEEGGRKVTAEEMTAYVTATR